MNNELKDQVIWPWEGERASQCWSYRSFKSPPPIGAYIPVSAVIERYLTLMGQGMKAPKARRQVMDEIWFIAHSAIEQEDG